MTNTVQNIPELLIPAGDFEKMRIAYAFGADAVYAGVPKFSLRTREIGFRSNDLAEAVQYAHSISKKIYLAMNIYAHNTKVDAFLKELDAVAEMQSDGIIMTDPGLIWQALKRYPNLTVHLSTQSNTTNYLSVKMWQEMGVKRIILTRELHLDEIAAMHQQVPDMELEAFVHGAICIAYSGRCLISNYMNHRDANQGTCTNSCRWEYHLAQDRHSLRSVENEQTPYETYTVPPEHLAVSEKHRPGEQYPITEDEFGTYLFNARDLCAIELIPDLMKSGVISLKVEGRTKSAYYAAVTSRAYRRAIDDAAAGKAFDSANLDDLLALSNRTYTSGFYTRNPRQYGENFSDGYSASDSHQVTGILRGYDSKRSLAEITIKNRIEKGDILELLTPNETVSYKVTDLLDENMTERDALHGGAGNGWINMPLLPGEYGFLRKRI